MTDWICLFSQTTCKLATSIENISFRLTVKIDDLMKKTKASNMFQIRSEGLNSLIVFCAAVSWLKV